MITKLKHSWEIFKASITLTFRHRKLLWFPFLNTVFTAVIAVFFLSAMALPMALKDTGYSFTQPEHWEVLMQRYGLNNHDHPALKVGPTAAGIPMITQKNGVPIKSPWPVLILLPVYFISMFLATFLNVAYYSEIIAALNGRGVSLRRGFGVARRRLPAILAWSLMAGLVGWLIRAVQERLPFGGRIVMGLIGIAWSVATVFAIPVIIQEESARNPLKILRQSAATLKRTWGEGLLGYIGFSASRTAIFLLSLLPFLLGCGLAYLSHSILIFVISSILWMICLMAVAYVSGVASQVYRCALYIYAAEGVIPEPYNQELMDGAWRIKKS
jgi:hypothetical protein